MKRILAITLTLIMLLAALTGCMASRKPSGDEGEQNPSGGHLPIILTIAETEPSCPAFESDCFYAFDTEGILYRVLWTDFEGLHEKDTVAVEYSKKEELNIPADLTGGFHAKYEITANNVKKDINPEDHLVSHIQIKSGANTIHPFGSLLWSETDHGDGFVDVMHADYVEITDMVKRCADVIPKLVLDESVSYLVQVNGRVENVYLLTPNGDTYAKSETTFDALSNLEYGTYYVAFEVLLSGNCDPDAPQNSSRYQDIFCLVVGEDYLVSHIQIKSGANTIHPFGCMTWSKIDNDDGTFTESFVDKYDVIDLVSGKTPFAITDIPKLVLNDKVSYFVQVNGRVEKVYLLTPNDDTYTKSETTFDALSNLADGTYYVVLEVLLSGNCDPDAPQNSYRYEDVFCLVVGDDDNSHDDGIPPYYAMLNLEVWDGKFLFQRIATTPCIVYSNTPINDMSKGTVFEDRHDILTTIFQAMHGKDAIMDTPECEFSRYIYMFDNERENIPWHYRFAICNCGAVMITNNDELLSKRIWRVVVVWICS